MSEPVHKDKPERAPGPLASLAGVKPPAPEWFDHALSDAAERHWLEVQGAKIEYLVWGRQGAPGLLLLHGNGAHADWWAFIAPILARDYRVAALSWSGMGGSDWRSSYSVDLYIEEAFSVARAAGLYSSAIKPVVLGHSFGGFPTMAMAARRGAELRSVVLLDTPLLSPEQRKARRSPRDPSRQRKPHRIYANFNEALARFRLMPEQPCDNLFIVDYIGRTSIRQVPPDEAQPSPGFSWRFDPFLWTHYVASDSAADLKAARCPVAVVWGERSALISPPVIEYMRSLAAPGSAFVEIPEAFHHVMLDQPLATVTVLRGLLAGHSGH